MSLRNSYLILPDLSNPPTPVCSSSASKNDSNPDKDSDWTDMATMTDLSQDTWLGKIYFPVPFLFEEANNMT